MERSSRGQAYEITLLRGRPRGGFRRRRPGPAFAEAALAIYSLDRADRRVAATRYLEDVLAPRAIAFCHRLARRLARYR